MNFLYLNSDSMGQGDLELGHRLLISFLGELAKSEVRIDAVGCVNRGAFLTTQRANALEPLRALQDRGARIATCGTCLEYYGLTHQLTIGEIGSMDGTVRLMTEADRVIRPC